MIHDDKILLKPSQLTLNDVRAKISGFHFSKEALSKGEREILFLAESLLDYIDMGVPLEEQSIPFGASALAASIFQPPEISNAKEDEPFFDSTKATRV